jgi:hypothetical protein
MLILIFTASGKWHQQKQQVDKRGASTPSLRVLGKNPTKQGSAAGRKDKLSGRWYGCIVQ